MGLIRVWQGFSKSLGKGLSVGLGKGCAKVEARFMHYFNGKFGHGSKHWGLGTWAQARIQVFWFGYSNISGI